PLLPPHFAQFAGTGYRRGDDNADRPLQTPPSLRRPPFATTPDRSTLSRRRPERTLRPTPARLVKLQLWPCSSFKSPAYLCRQTCRRPALQRIQNGQQLSFLRA